jgi:hypothetical protein
MLSRYALSMMPSVGNEMMTRKRKTLMCVAALVAVTGAFIAYAAMQVECPYCHNADGNVKDNCVLRQRTGGCAEDYYGQHHNKSNCPWCGSRGRMSRVEAWMD